MIVGVPRETATNERRVALVPSLVSALSAAGCEVLVETDAGTASGHPDSQYIEAGAKIASRAEVFAQAELILSVHGRDAAPEAGGKTVIGFLDPLGGPEAMKELSGGGATLLSMELMPRITRAQSMDALSSMAVLSGYQAVIQAALSLPRIFPMMMTAAGTVTPARVFVIGAGVAGLQAIATAKRLGAKVEAYDVRPAAAEQIESVGAKAVVLDLETGDSEDKGGYAKAQGEDFYERQRELLADVVSRSDVVITTAAIPGKPSPLLVTEDAVARMPKGGVIVDLAAERGGNCALSKADETVVVHGITIHGPTNLPSEVAMHASQMYAKNIVTFVQHLLKEGQLTLDLEDEITAGTLVARGGKVVHPRICELLGETPSAPPASEKPAEETPTEEPANG
ncbi:MAG: Re/Si-specific NAD(P)(+) transhydrogenase subunit alpha [Chrysiogenetes bacterium]|nr:Re/Si-specific NAD(P)(+) transhydrogenase subunit alpha [Chrysiogenetes bacterium]